MNFSPPAFNMQVLVTVGSTKFDELLNAVFSEDVLSILVQCGYRSLTAQVGNSTYQVDAAKNNGELVLDIWKFKPTMADEYIKADLVISHAGKQACAITLQMENSNLSYHQGSGTILEVLRVGKPLIVVPNPTLLDNHQQDLCDALSELEYLLVASPSLVWSLSLVDPVC